MRVIELLPFHNETDLLLARVALMAGVVDRHVVAEADLTHQGDSKPLWLEGVDLPASVQRRKVTLPPGTGDQANWTRERDQRDALDALARSDVPYLNPYTLILSCDLDEIVDPAAIPRIAAACQHGPVALAMRMIYYGNREDPTGWQSAKAFQARHTPTSLSRLRLSACPTVPDCGWHLSYLGGPENRRRKVEAFAHAENRDGPAWQRIASAVDGPNGEQLVDFDPTELPIVLQDLITEVGP